MNVVIGGASGIGEAVARLLPGETLVADRVGGQVTCDITDPASLAALAGMVDHLDALVLTAGLSPSLADARLDPRRERQRPPAGAGGLRRAHRRGHGGGAAGVDGRPHGSAAAGGAGRARRADLARRLELTDSPEIAYMMSKLGVIRLVKRTAAAYGARGARIVSVSPGVVDTPMGKSETAAGNGTAEVAAAGAFGRQADPRSWPRSSSSSARRRPRSSPGSTGWSTAARSLRSSPDVTDGRGPRPRGRASTRASWIGVLTPRFDTRRAPCLRQPRRSPRMNPLVIVIPVVVVLAGVVLFAAARRRDVGSATGALSRETRKRDKPSVLEAEAEAAGVGSSGRGGGGVGASCAGVGEGRRF